MNARELIDQVEICVVENWRNSDLWKETEEVLEKIAQHYQVCPECRNDFDSMEYEEKTLLDLENRYSFSDIKDWVCEKLSLLTPKGDI